jgi:2-phosphosulfolactate phosphatase
VLSFCTSVDVAVGRGARVLPQRWADPGAHGEPAARGAVHAGRRDGPGPSLRPSSLLGLAVGTLLAIPSPNGASLCVAAARQDAVVLAGCLRNATAVAAEAAAQAAAGPVGVVPAGERWPDGTLRVAVEDALGAGAIVAALAAGAGGRTLSPEAELVAAQFAAAADDLPAVLARLASGRELIADGYGTDVDLAAAHDVSPAAPRLVDGVLVG